MSKQIARLLKTDMMGDLDLKSLAQLLRSRGRGNDTMLAHITAREAKRLKEEGGSGTINPDTGLPEYEDGFDSYPSIETAQQAETQQAQQASYEPAASEFGSPVMPTAQAPQSELPAYDYGAAFTPTAQTPVAEAVPVSYAPPLSVGARAYPGDIYEPQTAPAGAKPEKPGFFEGMTPEQKSLLLRGALGVGGGILGGIQGQQAQKQADKAKGEISAIGAPYQQAGKSMQDAALRGELTPAGQKQMQAARAQLAQGIEKRGGVGAAQAATQLAQLNESLLEQQYNYGLKVAQIGDSYAASAIKTGLTQNQAISSSMAAMLSALGGFYGLQPNVTAAPAKTAASV